MPIAITRKPPSSLDRCELSFLPRAAIDVHLAAEQHRAYEEALAALGCRVCSLPAEPQMPDSVFVEDAAVVLDEVAVITRPGAASRRRETLSVEAALAGHRECLRIEAPATLDGGDVLRLGRTLYVGASGRSNAEGVAQLSRLLRRYGYRVEAVPLRGCLHLKSAVTQIASDRLLINPDQVESRHFPGMGILNVHASEPQAANALRVGGAVIYPESAPRTRETLEANGIRIRSVNMSETEKAEGGVTCCSLIFVP